MRVSWPVQAMPQLQMPSVCAVTGQPATTSVTLVFQRHWAFAFLPRLVRYLVRMANPPVRVRLPVIPRIVSKVRLGRILWMCGLFVPIAGILLGYWLGGLLGIVVFVVLLVGGFVVSVVGQLTLDVVGMDNADGWLAMRQSHRAFVEAFVPLNPPGTVWVEGTPPYQPPRSAPQQPPAQQPSAQPGRGRQQWWEGY